MYEKLCFLKKFIEKILITCANLLFWSSQSFRKSETENICRLEYSRALNYFMFYLLKFVICQSLLGENEAD
jgi:hypothetical protein